MHVAGKNTLFVAVQTTVVAPRGNVAGALFVADRDVEPGHVSIIVGVLRRRSAVRFEYDSST